MKDISDYIKFDDCPNEYNIKKTIDEIIGLPIVVRGWVILKSHWRNGKYAKVKFDTQNGKFYVNLDSKDLLEELKTIQQEKEKGGETDMSFTCTIKETINGLKMFPVKFADKTENDCQEK